MKNHSHAPIYAALVLMTILFGSSFIATKIALEYLHPFQIVGLRYIIAFLAMTSLWKLRHSFKLLTDPALMKEIMLIILMGPILYFFFETFGLKYAKASEISFMISLIPVATFITASVILKEKLHLFGKIAIVFSVIGALLLIFGDTSTNISFSGSMIGKLFGLGAVLSSSIYNVLVRKTTQKVSPLQLTYLQSFVAGIFYLILSFFVQPANYVEIALANSTVIYALLFLGVGCSFIAIYFMNLGFAHLESTRVALFGNFVPVVTLTIAWFIGMGFMSPLQLAGGLLILTSLFLANKK
ncbi:MAG: DMT family transporter [Calditrichia bacterium]